MWSCMPCTFSHVSFSTCVNRRYWPRAGARDLYWLCRPEKATVAVASQHFFVVSARCLSAGRTWDSRVDQQGFEPPPAVCQRWQDQRHTNWAIGSPAVASQHFVWLGATWIGATVDREGLCWRRCPEWPAWNKQSNHYKTFQDKQSNHYKTFQEYVDFFVFNLGLEALDFGQFNCLSSRSTSRARPKQPAPASEHPSAPRQRPKRPPQDGHGHHFCGRRSLPFGGSHLRLPSGPAGIRTTTGSLSALARATPYQLNHRVASRRPWTPTAFSSL